MGKRSDFNRKDLTQRYLRKILSYNPSTGIFIWRIKTFRSKANVGDTAGCDNGIGYIKIGIRGIAYYAHRLAHLYMVGKFPKELIDHINQNGLDNRWCNLRQATKSQNMINKKKIRRNKSGYNGVTWHKKAKKYEAYVTHKRKKYYIGLFTDIKEAAQKRDDKAVELFGEYAELNFDKNHTGPTQFIGR